MTNMSARIYRLETRHGAANTRGAILETFPDDLLDAQIAILHATVFGGDVAQAGRQHAATLQKPTNRELLARYQAAPAECSAKTDEDLDAEIARLSEGLFPRPRHLARG